MVLSCGFFFQQVLKNVTQKCKPCRLTQSGASMAANQVVPGSSSGPATFFR